MKTMNKIVFIVIILSIYFFVKNDPLKLFKNNPLNKVNGKAYINEELGTAVYFEGKKASLSVEGDEIGWIKYDRKWKKDTYLYNSERDRDFYFVFILKDDIIYFTAMHRFEILEIERSSDNPFANSKVNKSRSEFIALKLIEDINSYYNSLGEKINNEKANNERANNQKVNNKGIERYAGSWCMNYSGENELLFVISSDGNITFSDGQIVKAKDITKSSDTSYSFENNDGTIELDFYEDINCSMTTYSQDKAGFVIDLVKNN